MFGELIATEGVLEELVLRGSTGVMALHGGLEAGTAEAARRCSRRAGASLYVVEQPDGFRWHIPSTRYDPARSTKLRSFLEHVRLAVSIHGFGHRAMPFGVLVGGGNRRLRRRLADAISARTEIGVLADVRSLPRSLRGLHPRNPVNLPELGGAQLELAPHVRSGASFDEVVEAVTVVLSAEQASLCGGPGRSSSGV